MRAADKPAARGVLPPTLLMIAAIGMIVLHFLFRGIQWLIPPLTWVGGLPIVSGLILYFWADAVFKRHRTPFSPFATPTVMIVDGPFVFTRNPMYLGMVMALIGLGGLLGSLTPFVVPVLFALYVRRYYISVEEARLEDTFGEAFNAYRRRVRRWF